MSDALEIANLKALYCRAADRASEDETAARAMFAGLFTDDFVADYGYGALEGPQAVTDFLCDAITRGTVWMIHMLHSPSIEVTGDIATGEWTVMAHARRQSGELSVVLGRYSDTFRRTVEGWRIARIVFSRPE